MKIQSQYLDGDYLEKNPTFHIEDSPWKADQIFKGMERNSLRPRVVAEVGCGAGEILTQLAKKIDDCQFHGYEISPQGYEFCVERQNDRIRFHNRSIFEDNIDPFDLLLCIDVFEHIEDCFDFLRKLSKISKYHIFHIPLDMNVQMVARSEPILRVRQSVGHLHYFSRDTALALLQDTGYEVIDSFFTPNGVDRPKSSKARILQAPRKLLQLFSEELSARFLGGYSLLVVAKPKVGISTDHQQQSE